MSSEFISIIILGALCIYQSYRLGKLKLDMLDQLIELWRCQKRTLQFIKDLYERNENE